MTTQYVNVLEKYKLFFVNRPFTFPGDKTVNKKIAIHRIENDFLGYFLNCFADQEAIDEIITQIDCIISEGFYDPGSCEEIYLHFLTMRYTDTSVVFEDMDINRSYLQEIHFSEFTEILLLWKNFIHSPPFDRTILDDRTEFCYHLKKYESEQEVALSLVKTFSEIDFTLIRGENIGEYRKEFSAGYTKGKSDEFYITCLYDKDGRMIYEKEENYFKEGSEVVVRKYYFDEQISYHFELLYNEKGEFSAIENRNPEIPYIYACEMDLLCPGFLAKNPYYKNSDIIP